MKRFSIILASLVFLFICSTVWADIPNLINFQGILDSAGNPLANKTVSVEFKIYDALVGGSLKWSETQSVTTNAGGVFNVSLGLSNPVPDSAFSAPVRYLGIKVGTDPEMSPRQQIVSNAYAYQVGTVSASEIVDEPGISNKDQFSFFGLGSGNITYVVDSVDITIPAAGYVEVTCGAFLALAHTAGTITEIDLQSGKTSGFFDFVPGVGAAALADIFGSGASIPSGLYIFPATASRLYVETAGTHRYYLHLNYISGTSTSSYSGMFYIRAKYYPTLYGTVTLAEAQGGSSALSKTASGGSQSQVSREIKTITMEEHNAHLQAEIAQIKAELEARMQKLEEQLKRSQNTTKDEK